MSTLRDLDGSDLVLGVATASFQIEGATSADGRGPSIWDTLCRRPGAIKDGSDGSTACGSYDRVDEDLDLIRDLGVEAYRFSIAWPRVQPDGRGEANAAGLDHYERVVDGCLARGIVPLPTLYHWDLPQPLEDDGGWPARATAQRLADYAGIVARRLGDRVTWWSTLNEPWCSAFLGYAAGIHAPGRQEPAAAFAAAHHLLLGHALAAEAVRAAAPAASVGIVLNLAPVWPEEDAAREAADYVDAIQNRLWLDALVDGSYPAILPALHDPALVRDGDLAAIAGSAAWLGINYYTPFRIGPAGEGAGSERVQSPRAYPGAPSLRFLPREPVTEMGWEVDASGLEEVLLTTSRRAPGLPLMVTENGSAYADATRSADGSAEDDDRIAYLRDHLAATRRARDAGADVRAYIAWTLLDNFEWAEGYTKKFGLVEVEAGTLRRIPKASYRYYAGLAGRAKR
ncbi:MAG: broad-specificity cellobiase [Frankiales bacterium]|nr:broad-specificity cellobiase [Frankiales bacterium]